MRHKNWILFNIIYLSVTLDYKALLLLLNKPDDENFQLGGKGFEVEFCAFCDAIRVNTYYIACHFPTVLLILYSFEILNNLLNKYVTC